MAEPSNVAFGRYLKMLRERRNLSLDDVYVRSQSFPETLQKGYISRVENGHQKLAFAKMIPLSRILEVPSDVLVERMELDLELDKVGGPETRGKAFGELNTAASDAIKSGRRWDAYACARDGLHLAGDSKLNPKFRDLEEQRTIALMNCATAAKALGRYLYPLFELRHVRELNALSARFRPIATERLGICYQRLGQYDSARKLLEQAITEAEDSEDSYALGYTLSSRALQATLDKEVELAIELYMRAYRAFERAELHAELPLTMTNIAQCYFDTGKLSSAKRSLTAARKLVSSDPGHRVHALCFILRGEIELLNGHEAQAIRLWRDASRLARKLNDRELRFKAGLLLLKRARTAGNPRSERVVLTRLRRLAPWLAPDSTDLLEFKSLDS